MTSCTYLPRHGRLTQHLAKKNNRFLTSYMSEPCISQPSCSSCPGRPSAPTPLASPRDVGDTGCAFEQPPQMHSRRLNGKQRPATTQAVPLSSRRRLNGKQRLATALSADPSASLLAATAVAAACGDDSLALLPATVKRKHVHWTHVRAWGPNHAQPDAFSKKEFSQHLRGACLEVYHRDQRYQAQTFPLEKLAW